MSTPGRHDPDPAPQDMNEELDRSPMTVDAATELLQQVVDTGGVPGQEGPIRIFVPRHGLVSFTTNARGRVTAHP